MAFVQRVSLPVVVVLLASLLAACDPTNPTTPSQPEPKPEPAQSAGRELHAPIDRANAVEGQVLDQAKAQDEAMRAQGG